MEERHNRRGSWLRRRFGGLLRAGHRSRATLYVPGRRSGRLKAVSDPVIELDSGTYVIAGPHTNWARNARQAGWGELVLGDRHDRVSLLEVPQEVRSSVLKASWGLAGRTRDLVAARLRLDSDADVVELDAAADRSAVFVLLPVPSRAASTI